MDFRINSSTLGVPLNSFQTTVFTEVQIFVNLQILSSTISMCIWTLFLSRIAQGNAGSLAKRKGAEEESRGSGTKCCSYFFLTQVECT